MKQIFILGSCFFLAYLVNAQSESSLVATTRYFEFHNNYWTNLHHFLFQKAKGDQLKHLEEDGQTFLDIGEVAIWEELDTADSTILQNTIAYYQEHIINRSLMRNSALRLWLQSLKEEGEIVDTTYSAELTGILNKASPIFTRYFWPVFKMHNDTILAKHVDLVRKFETIAIQQMEKLAGYPWPDLKVRVDLTAYANWAGAYTPARPTMNIFISTIDPGAPSSYFLETVFHEGAHLLYSRESAFRSKIYHRSKEREMDFPKQLWHASLFYLCGRITQDLMEPLGVRHTLTMDDRHVFDNYNTPSFRATLEKYYRGQLDIDTTVDQLLDQLK